MFNVFSQTTFVVKSVSGILVSALSVTLLLVSPIVKSATLKDFSAKFNVQVASFNIGQGTHVMQCQSHQCTLESAAKPSGFIRNFFKDELYETAHITQTDTQFEWLSYQKKEVRYKGNEVSKRIKTFKKIDDTIVWVEKNQRFPLNAWTFDQMSIAYAIQWLRLNQAPKMQFDQLVLQTDKTQSKVNFQEFSQATTLRLDFAQKPLDAEKFVLITEKVKVELWCLADYDWFPAKIKIYNKDKDRTITLNLAKAPSFVQ